MVEIHSATAEIRRGKKIEEDRKTPKGKNIVACPLFHRAAIKKKQDKNTRMWASAQRGGCPAEYRWRPLFNAAKFG